MPNHTTTRADQQKWNTRYQDVDTPPRPAQVLTDNAHLLPPIGRALDLACGLGGNALQLAEYGLETWAWDISDVAIARLQQVSRQRGCAIQAEVRDVVAMPPAPERFDVIVVSRFLERTLFPALLQALRPQGLLLYQTFLQMAVDPGGPQNPAYRLAPQELLTLCRPLHILVYREEGRVGDLTRGFRNEAMLIGQRV